jgi:short-subunit dehydrogenase
VNKPVALVTGASSGLGEVFARKLAARGYDLILVARREDKLRALANDLPVNIDVVTADLATEEGVAATERAIRECPRLQLLVNNAGFGTLGRFWEAELKGQQEMHLVHVMATMRLTHAALKAMVPRTQSDVKPGGLIGVINVSSVAGFGQSEGNVSYCSTKAWMTSFSLGLDLELRGKGSPVRVQALCPGFTYTEFHETLGVDRATIPRFLWLKADFVVESSLRGLERGKALEIPDWKYKSVAALMKHLPGSLTRGLRPGRDKRV